jgi:hypothetical protein
LLALTVVVGAPHLSRVSERTSCIVIHVAPASVPHAVCGVWAGAVGVSVLGINQPMHTSMREE